MAKHWDWYEVEFERVADKLPTSRKTEILDSLREHVHEAVSAKVVEGAGELEAEKEAIRQLGPPSEVVRMERDQPKWQWVPVWIAWVGLLWCTAWLIAGSLMWTMRNILPVLWITPLAVFLATLVGRRVKLWAIAGAVAGSASIMLAGVSFCWLNLSYAGGLGMTPRWDITGYEAETKAKIAGLEARINDARQADAAFQKGNDSLLMLHLRSPNGMWRIQGSDNNYTSSYEKAREGWRLNIAVDGYRAERLRQKSILQSYRDPRSFQPARMFVESIPVVVMISAAAYSVLGAAHLLGLLVVWLPSSLNRRRWRIASG